MGRARRWTAAGAALLAGAALAGLPGPGRAQAEGPRYDAVLLGSRAGFATALSSAGQVVGLLSGPDAAFSWSGGTLTELPAPGPGFWVPRDVNASGWVVGSWLDSGRSHGVLLRDGQFTDLTAPDAETYLTALNDAGQIAGYHSDPELNRPPQGFRWQAGVFTTVPNTAPAGINSAGDLTGSYFVNTGPAGRATVGPRLFKGDPHAFLWHDGTLTDLNPAGANRSNGSALNDLGEVVGSANAAGAGDTSVFWHNGRALPLGGTPGYRYTYPEDVNHSGAILGNAGLAHSDGSSAGVLYLGTGPVPLQRMLVGSPEILGVTRVDALNDAGQVAGAALIRREDGTTASLPVLLTPHEGAAPPLPPTELQATLKGGPLRPFVVLQWSHAAGAADYEVVRSTYPKPGQGSPLAQPETVVASGDFGAGATDRSVEPGVRYLYRVRERNAAGWSRGSDPATVTTAGGKLQVSPRSLTFPATRLHHESRRRQVRVRNTGDFNLFLSVEVNPPIPFRVQAHVPRTSEFVLAPGKTLELQVTFAPFLKGPAAAKLVVRSSDRDVPAVNVRLSGRGI